MIGQPVIHSLSPQLHQQFAKANKQTIAYGKISCHPNDFNACVQAFKNQGGRGLSITLPFKQQAAELADAHDQHVKLTGVANGLHLTPQSIAATNSDGTGLVQDLLSKNITLKNKNILIIGAGGAARGIIPALAEQQPTLLAMTNRTPTKTQQLMDHFAHLLPLKIKQGDTNTQYDVIINASSAGHFNQAPKLHHQWFTHTTTAYDLSYSNAAQPFITCCQQLGVQQCFDGYGMLAASAKQLYEWWSKYDNTL